MGKEILRVEDVRIGFEKEGHSLFRAREKKEVLQGVSFSMEEGEVLGLVGESGCGKSTLSKVVLGLQKPDAGKVVHFSANPQMVFQDPYGSLNPSRKIGWILEEPLRIRGGFTKRQRREKALAMLER